VARKLYETGRKMSRRKSDLLKWRLETYSMALALSREATEGSAAGFAPGSLFCVKV
jgi:hypothetical protein